MRYFETHAHPDFALVENKKDYVLKSREAGIEIIVDVAVSYESNQISTEMFPADEYPDVLFAKGLHPKNARNSAMWTKSQRESFEKEFLHDPRVVALKSGLDFCKKKITEQQNRRQYDFLKMFMNLAEDYNKPLVLHIREAAEEAIDFFKDNPIRVPAEIHCFAYDKSIMNRFIYDAGIRYFGIGGKVTYIENEELRESVREMPLEMILLESDAPFVKVEGETERINTSARAIPTVAKAIADLKGISEEEVAEVTYKNACRFFGLQISTKKCSEDDKIDYKYVKI